MNNNRFDQYWEKILYQPTHTHCTICTISTLSISWFKNIITQWHSVSSSEDNILFVNVLILSPITAINIINRSQYWSCIVLWRQQEERGNDQGKWCVSVFVCMGGQLHLKKVFKWVSCPLRKSNSFALFIYFKWNNVIPFNILINSLNSNHNLRFWTVVWTKNIQLI